MSFTERDKAAARAILSVFETSQKQGDPAAVAVLDDGAGVSYGIKQFTHGGGALEEVLREFARLAPAHQASATRYADQLRNRSAANVEQMGADLSFRQWLRQAGRTPEMRTAQETIADRNYLNPALAECERNGFIEPLSLAVVFDSYVQGSWERCKRDTNAKHRRPVPEKRWIVDYLATRTQFLQGRKSGAARASVYRPATFQKLIERGNWKLATPFTVHGRTIEEDDL